MKTISSFLGLFLCAALAVAEVAPKEVDVKKPAGLQPGSLLSRLELTDEQWQKIQEVRKNGGGLAAVNKILTPEQRAKMDRLRRPGTEATRKDVKRISNSLDLSDDQLEKMNEIVEAGGGRTELYRLLSKEDLAEMRAYVNRPRTPAEKMKIDKEKKDKKDKKDKKNKDKKNKDKKNKKNKDKNKVKNKDGKSDSEDEATATEEDDGSAPAIQENSS